MDNKTGLPLYLCKKDVPSDNVPTENVPTRNQEPTFIVPEEFPEDDELVVKVMTKKNNPFDLSPQERRVLYHWQKTGNQAEAYKRVFISEYDQQSMSKNSIRKRITRFYDTYRIREAMAASPGERGKKAREDLQKWRQKQQEAAIAKFSATAQKIGQELGVSADKESNEDNYNEGQDGSDQNASYSSDVSNVEVDQAIVDQIVKAITQSSALSQNRPIYNDTGSTSVVPVRNDKDLWIESLNINKDPSAMSIYGTGQFLAYVAVKEIMDRQKAIKEQKIGVLEKNGSALTPNIINAIKTAAAMILPFAPAPSAEDRREMSKAAVLLGLMPDRIEESPDAYTAPPPITVDVTQGD